MTNDRWTRRSALVLGLSAVGLCLAVDPAPAVVLPVSLGDLTFDVPTDVRPAAQVPGITRPWPWQGTAPVDPGAPPSMIVLARADLASTDAEEILGLLLAGTVGGQLPGLLTQPRRIRALGGGRGEQVRVDLSYAAGSEQTYRGTVLIATRPAPPAAVLVVLGNDSLTAGTVSAVLDSLRWTS